MTLIAGLLLIIPALFGGAVLASLNAVREKVTVMLVGTTGGIVVGTTLTYLLTLLFPLNIVLLLAVLGILAAATAGFLLLTDAWKNFRRMAFDQMAAGIFVVLLALFAIIAPKLLIETGEGLSTGIINAYGDVAWHVSNITAFAAGQPFPPENPIFAGTPLVYPFLANFFSAMLIIGGASVAQSVTIPAALLIPLALTLLFVFAQTVSHGRRAAALIALILFLFGGAALGWMRLVPWLGESGLSFWKFLIHLPDQDFSGVGTEPLGGFHFLNPVTTLLLPQRPFLFGLSIGLAILTMLTAKRSWRTHAAAGVLAGLLPLAHAHTTLALTPAILALMVLHRHRAWVAFILPAALIGLPEVAYHLAGIHESQSFFRWAPSWMAGDTNVIWYWLKNTGLVLPAIIVAFFLPAPRIAKVLAAAGLVLFVAANLFAFAPWLWDNYKLFVWWFVLGLPLIGWLVSEAWRILPRWPLRAVIVLILIFHTASAVLDIWKLALPTASQWSEWDAEAVAFARDIQSVTQPGDVILTAPIHNSPVALTGRKQYLGYPAHIWSHGGDPWEREQAIPLFYQGASDVLPDIQPQYVLVGPVERMRYPNIIRDDWQEVARAKEYTLYKLR